MPVTITLTNYLALDPRELPAGVVEQVQERLSFPNPVWLENQKRGYSNWQVPEILRFYGVQDGRLLLPRGFIRTALWLLKENGIAYTLDDRRRTFAEVEFRFYGKLKDFQMEAGEAAWGRDFGVLAAPTGSGKTVIALALVAARPTGPGGGAYQGAAAPVAGADPGLPGAPAGGDRRHRRRPSHVRPQGDRGPGAEPL